MYQFKQNVAIRIPGNGRVVIGGGRFAKSIVDNEANRALLRGVSRGQSISEIVSQVEAAGLTLAEADVEMALEQLVSANLVEEKAAEPAKADHRLSRQELFFSLYSTDREFPAESSRLLAEARVLILGCGGVGSMTALNLAAIGVGHIRIVDFDTIDVTNLNRSFIFQAADIGRPKVEVLQERLPIQFPDTQFEFYSAKIGDTEDLVPFLDGVTLAVLAADSPYLKINRWFNGACLSADVPYTLAGCSESYGSVGPLTVPGETSCFECQGFDLTDIGEGPEFSVETNAKRKAPSFAPLISTVASLNVLEIVKYLTRYESPQILNTQLRFEFDTMELVKVDRSPTSTCDCGARFETGIVVA
ncbi:MULTISPECIES: ThiF family adenylyltransferase [unclassified Curtobacterium]|uniref:HesA/MoeB/ThiF family protein n=1 Tax=unclassified Curtobacterium TaxID=257496 RepID=UPI0011CE7513|nr:MULTISPECIES: ThiF family adenylyltransferase [unclassified Curtobacterium]